jgi:hypothetical protein
MAKRLPVKANRSAFDRWTIAHVAVGALAGVAGVPALPLFALAAGYEVLEQVVERSPMGRRVFGTLGPESAANVAADLLVLGAAYAVASSLTRVCPGAVHGLGWQ